MDIQYAYEIFIVDEAANTMEVVYTSEGRSTHHICVPIPSEGTSLETVLAIYAPIPQWVSRAVPLAAPAQGTRGQLTYTPPTPRPLDACAREDRDAALSATDWTQLPDSPISAEQKVAWAAYRQALRDVPQQSGFPDTVEWPVKPT